MTIPAELSPPPPTQPPLHLHSPSLFFLFSLSVAYCCNWIFYSSSITPFTFCLGFNNQPEAGILQIPPDSSGGFSRWERKIKKKKGAAIPPRLQSHQIKSNENLCSAGRNLMRFTATNPQPDVPQRGAKNAQRPVRNQWHPSPEFQI